MTLSQAKETFIFSEIKIEFDKDNYVILREPNVSESSQIYSQTGSDEEKLKLIFEKCYVSSSFTDDEKNPAQAKDVFDFICQSAVLATEVIKRWQNANPFASRVKLSKK